MEPGIVTIAIYIALVLFVPAVLVGIYGRLGILIEIARRIEARSGGSPARIPEPASHSAISAPDAGTADWGQPMPRVGKIILGVLLVAALIAVVLLSLR